MQNEPKYKIGEQLFLKMGVNLENARSKYLNYFPKFLSHPLYAGYLDQKVLLMKPLKVVKYSYFADLNEYYYDLTTSLNGEIVTFRKLENFLTQPIVAKIAKKENSEISIKELTNKLINGEYIDKVNSAIKLKKMEFIPQNVELAIPYYLYTDDFVNLVKYDEKVVVPLLEYLFICADEKKVPDIFGAFMQLGEHSIAPLLHLFTIPRYEHRDLVYYVLGEIGNAECIEYFETMKQQEDKYIRELTEGLQKLINRFY
ncbi:MAG: hypothetical protein JXL97_03345 [Bacteroidales bacterium]|nr:hypothetical protein [Bacteroidales bacterium]